jgi:adenine deaminase
MRNSIMAHEPPFPRITPEFLAIARGDAPADLLITGARVVNVFTRTIELADVVVHGGRIAAVASPGSYTDAAETLDAASSYIAPGFIDAHMHVESTMLPPSQFVRLAVPHGTTGAVFDPHEIANVLGVAGIRYLMDNAEGLPINAMWAVSSCVPSSPLETAGAVLSAGDLAPLFDDDRVVALAEMMNFPGVVFGVPDVLEKVNLGLSRRIVDGHSPGLAGKHLQAYVAAGISSDHECTTLAEAREKLALGMQVYIREGSAARNLDALLPAVTPGNAHRFCFCTDDRHPADLKDEGHIDHVVRRAIALGLDPATAIAIGSLHPARHYGRRDLGAVAPGHHADLIVFDDLDDLRPRLVYHHGVVVARDGRYVGPELSMQAPPASGVRLPAGFDEGSLRIDAANATGKIRVIGMDPHQLITEHLVLEPRIEGGEYVADTARDILKLVVIERHKGTGNIGRGFVHGFALTDGAIASTVGHDSHNLAVLGTNDGDMLVAARALADAGGGQCAVRDGQVLALLPLPVAGLMSDRPAGEVIEQQAALLDAAHALGCPHHDPFMPLSFLPLPVIPKLKLSDLGLVDVERFEVIPLEA